MNVDFLFFDRLFVYTESITTSRPERVTFIYCRLWRNDKWFCILALFAQTKDAVSLCRFFNSADSAPNMTDAARNPTFPKIEWSLSGQMWPCNRKSSFYFVDSPLFLVIYLPNNGSGPLVAWKNDCSSMNEQFTLLSTGGKKRSKTVIGPDKPRSTICSPGQSLRVGAFDRGCSFPGGNAQKMM